MTTQLDKAAQVIREELLAGSYGGNAKLREQSLAEALGVSRTVTRLALGELEREGLVTREPNRGYRARSFTLEEVTDAILVRGELEGMAVRLCAEKGLQAEQFGQCSSVLVKLDSLLEQGVSTLEQRIQWIDLNARFHRMLITSSGNHVLADTITSLSRIPLVSCRAIVFDMHDEPQNFARLAASQKDHHDILDAIFARQGSRAENLTKEHARKSAENKRLGFDAMRQNQQSPALPGLALVRA